MNSLNYPPHMSLDHLSVEVNSDDYGFPLNQYDGIDDPNISTLFDLDLFGGSNISVAGFCESADIVASITHPTEPGEFDKYFGPEHLSNSISDIDQNLLAINNLPVYGVEKHKKVKLNKKPIFLSSSVGVGIPQRLFKTSHKIELVCELEEKYRPRYKSDYFAQNGKKRKPRYVTDRHGNHFITLKVPPGIQGQIRVDWVTIPDVNGERYTMPYRFQANNDSNNVADCNPIMGDIVHDTSGTTIKLYLVLIKAKQDALKSLQPLKPFHPMLDVCGFIDKHNPEKTAILTPKKLIEKYQLGKSQLAFTLCPLSIDGQSYIPEWDTTVYSTVLEEEAAVDSATGKTIACPHCSTSITINDEGMSIEQVAAPNKRKSSQMKDGKVMRLKKQRNQSEMIYYVN